MEYWLIKTLLVIGMVAVIFFVLRPVKTLNSLAIRRIGMLIVLLAAMFAVIFPEVFNRVARMIGVDTGINLLVYLLVIALFAQMASAYRRDSIAEKKLTELARQFALQRAYQQQEIGQVEEDLEEILEAETQAGESAEEAHPNPDKP